VEKGYPFPSLVFFTCTKYQALGSGHRIGKSSFVIIKPYKGEQIEMGISINSLM